MAIDTQDKRIASIGFGSAHRAGTRRPTGTSTAFVRGSVLGLYYQEPLTAPNDGWIPVSRSRFAVSESRERVSISESRNRVWIAKDKTQ